MYVYTFELIISPRIQCIKFENIVITIVAYIVKEFTCRYMKKFLLNNF